MHVKLLVIGRPVCPDALKTRRVPKQPGEAFAHLLAVFDYRMAVG